MNDSPIFIVGAPRSGTTMLSALLGSHPHLFCGPETHVISQLGRNLASDRNSLLTTKNFKTNWPNLATEFLSSIEHADGYVHDYCNVSVSEIREYLSAHPRSLATLIGCLPDIQRLRESKSRWVEKTPGHLLHVRQIRKHFPDAPIIRIVRDPRDVSLSLLAVPWGPKTLEDALALWISYDLASAAFFESDHLSITIRFEDILENPINELETLCDFIGEEFDSSMLDTAQAGKHVNRSGEPWKNRVGKPIDPSRATAWRGKLTSPQQRVSEALVGDRLRIFGYPQEFEFKKYCHTFPRAIRCRFGEERLIRHLVSEGNRFWASSKDEPEALRLFVGHPNHWFGESHLLSRLTTLSRIVRLSLPSNGRRESPRWYKTDSAIADGSRLAAVASRILEARCEQVPLSDTP